jgi:transposase-like protein
MDQAPGRRRRRTYSAEFKADAVAACRKPGVSIAAAALDRAINANLLRRWVVEAERAEAGMAMSPARAPSPPLTLRDSFVPVPMPPKAGGDTSIRVEVRRGTLTVSVQWPSSAMHECALWLREVLR